MRPKAIPCALAAALCPLVLCADTARAQEAMNMPAATLPSTGQLNFRQQLRYISYSNDPTPAGREVEEIIATTTLTYGLRHDLSVSFGLPLVYRDTDFDAGGSESDFGVSDMPLLFKYRFHQADTGPTDTTRAAVIFGAELPSGDNPFSSKSIDPMLGVVLTSIRGRHGFNASAVGKLNTSGGGNTSPVRRGDSKYEALFYDASYAYRLVPEAYGADTTAAVYAVVELNGLYETSGDNELFLSPGLLYEATRWAAELSVQIPIWQDMNARMETDFSVVAGLRLLF
jgi:hypothetical protein